MKGDTIKDMLKPRSELDTVQVGFLLLNDFSLLAFSAAVEPLRAANRLQEQPLFSWVTTHISNADVRASNGLEVSVNSSLDALFKCRLVLICSGTNVEKHTDKATLAIVRRLERNGITVGAICSGTYVLAKAGMLGERRCTIHWENIDAMREEFPHLEITNDLYEIDRTHITCSGGTAALDMMLHLISQAHGAKLAAEISETFIHDRIRDSHDRQRIELRSRLGVSHPKLLMVVANMEANLEEPLSQTELAEQANLSTRQLERLFKKYMQITPTRHYLNLRLARARYLLRQTSMSILSVALACGFISASHFSKCYRETYGCTPRAERETN